MAARNFRKNTILARRTRSTVRQEVKSLMAAELEHKFFDTALPASASSTGSVTHLSAVPQGDTSSSRDGEYIFAEKLTIHIGVTGADTTNFVRMIVFKDLDSQGVVPAVNNVLEPGTSFFDHMNNVNKYRFKIMLDRTVSTSLTGPNAHYMQLALKVNKKLSFSTTSTLPRLNALHILLISDSGAVTHPAVVGECRLWYTDA